MRNLNYIRYILIPALLAVLLIVYSCKENTVTPDENTGIVAGQIIDEQDIPVPGAIIQVFSTGSGIQGLFDKDTTDDEGFFELKNVPNDHSNLQVRIDHEDFASFDIPLAEMTKDKDHKKANVKIQHDSICTGTLTLNVINQNDEPLQYAEIRMNRGDKIIRKALTNADGNLTFENVCPGEYWLRIAKSGYKVVEQGFEIAQEETLNLGFELLGMDEDTCCKGVIYFEVKDSATQQALNEVRVKLYKGSDKINEGYTKEEGKFKFERVCEGNYQISFFREGYKAQEFNFEMGCNDTVEFSKLMSQLPPKDSCCNGAIYLIVKDSTTNQGIPYAFVNLWLGDKKIKEGKTNESGLVSFTGLCEGQYGLSILKEQYKSIEFSTTLACDDTLELTKYLVKSLQDSCCDGVIEIEVNDSETKEKINFAKVNLWKAGKLLKTGKTEAGIVKFTGLCVGEYGIDIIHEQYKAIEFSVTLECNKTVRLTKEIVKLTDDKDSCCNGVIIVAPRDSETKELIKGARVKLRLGDKVVYDKYVENQPLVLNNLCEGKYQFVFIANGYQSAEEDFVLPCNDTLEFPFFMQKMLADTCCNGKLKVIPMDSSGVILKGAWVKLWKDGKIIAEKKVEGDYVIFEELCKGKYSGSITLDGYKGVEFAIELGCNETKTIEKFLSKSGGGDDCCNGKVTFKFNKAESDQLIEGALTVRLWKDGKLLTKKVVDNSVAVFEKLCKGNYAVDVEHANYKSIEFSFELGCDEIKTIQKGLQQKEGDCCKGVIYLSVKDSANGSNLQNVTVNLWKGSTKVGYLKTGDNGSVKFENVCEGNYSFSFSKDGYKSREAGGIALGCNDTLELSYKMLKNEAVDTCYTAEIALVVKDKNTEERLYNVQIRVMDKSNGQIIAEGYTDQDGRFSKNNLKAPAAYKFIGTIDGYESAYVVVEWAKCEKKESVLLLQSK
jgi:5-hydroxyisourate hydrolase-like protein (transthyretin family)